MSDLEHRARKEDVIDEVMGLFDRFTRKRRRRFKKAIDEALKEQVEGFVHDDAVRASILAGAKAAGFAPEALDAPQLKELDVPSSP